MTLYITIETAIGVLKPFCYRKYCTRKKTLWLLIASIIISFLLHLIFLCTHEIKTRIMLIDSKKFINYNYINNFFNTTISPVKITTTTILKTEYKSKIIAEKTNNSFNLQNITNWSSKLNKIKNSTNETFQNNELQKRCWQLLLSYTMQPISTLLKNEMYEKIYYWLQIMASIVLPTLAMLFCSFLIVTRFTFKVKK